MVDVLKTTHNFPTSYVSNSKTAVLKSALWTLCHQMQEVVWGDSWNGNSVVIDKDRSLVSEVHHDLNHCHYSSIWGWAECGMWLTEDGKDVSHPGNLAKVKIESMNRNGEEAEPEIFSTQHRAWPYKNKSPKYHSAWEGANVIFWIIFVGCMSILTMIY